MATSFEESEKLDVIKKIHEKYLPFGENIVKIGQVDTETALLIVKNKEKKKKLTQVKYIVRSAGLPSGLKKSTSKNENYKNKPKDISSHRELNQKT